MGADKEKIKNLTIDEVTKEINKTIKYYQDFMNTSMKEDSNGYFEIYDEYTNFTYSIRTSDISAIGFKIKEKDK